LYEKNNIYCFTPYFNKGMIQSCFAKINVFNQKQAIMTFYFDFCV